MAERIETIGCDLGDRQSELCVLLASGEVERPKPVKSTRAAMRAFFMQPRAHVVIEVGAHSRWVSQLLKDMGHEVTVANPRRVQLISQNDSKDDRTDAELLARLGRADKKLLAPIEHRGNQAQADLAVAKARDVLVRCRTTLVNHARGLVKSFGERLPKCTAECFHRKARSSVPDELKLKFRTAPETSLGLVRLDCTAPARRTRPVGAPVSRRWAHARSGLPAVRRVSSPDWAPLANSDEASYEYMDALVWTRLQQTF